MAKFVMSGFSDEIDRDLRVQIRELKRNQIDRMEIRFVNGKSIIDYSLKETREIKKQLDASGISLSAIGSPIGKIKITDPFGPHLDQFKHTVEIAGILETKYIRMFSFYIPKEDTPEKYRDEVLDRWSSFVDAARGTGLILAHENEKGIYGDIPGRCAEIMQAMDSDYVRTVFDPANFIQCNAQTWPEAYESLKPYIAYMHIKDALYSNGMVVPAGFGDGRLPDILNDLNKSVQGEMVLSLEPHLGSFEGLASLEKEIDLSNLEESGPGKFQIAAQALRKVLKTIGYGIE